MNTTYFLISSIIKFVFTEYLVSAVTLILKSDMCWLWHGRFAKYLNLLGIPLLYLSNGNNTIVMRIFWGLIKMTQGAWLGVWQEMSRSCSSPYSPFSSSTFSSVVLLGLMKFTTCEGNEMCCNKMPQPCVFEQIHHDGDGSKKHKWERRF